MADQDKGIAAGDADEAALLTRNGITKVTVHQFHVDDYRYSSLADALAQVRRSAAEWRAKQPAPLTQAG